MNVIAEYASILVRSEAHPKDRDDFSETVERAIRPQEKNRHMLMAVSDFNAKTDSGYPQYKHEIGKYRKRFKKSHGDALLQLAK